MAKQKSKNSKGIIAAIIIITIFIIFVAWLRFDYTYTNPGGLGPNCVESINFICQNPIYNHSTGNIIVTIGQSTSINWTTANFVFVQYETPILNEIPNVSFTSYNANTTYGVKGKGLPTGKNITLSLPVSGPVSRGIVMYGQIWVQYTTQQNNTPQYVEMATIDIKAS